MKKLLLAALTLILPTIAFAQTPGATPVDPDPEGVRLKPIPDKLIVLTFDDSSASHYAVARPVLKRYGFGATFFITEGFTFAKNKTDYMTWAQIAELHRDGFEIGNHTRDHLSITEKTVPRLAEQLAVIADRCREHGIPAPVSFAWPGNKFHVAALPILQAAGIRFARRGGEPEIPYSIGGGVAYEPGLDHPLLIPTTGDARPNIQQRLKPASVAEAGVNISAGATASLQQPVYELQVCPRCGRDVRYASAAGYRIMICNSCGYTKQMLTRNR